MNLLLGQDAQAVSEVRAGDGRGQHTTTHRQMFRIPGGGWLIDQPGIREIHITADQGTVRDAFPEVAELALQCRFGIAVTRGSLAARAREDGRGTSS